VPLTFFAALTLLLAIRAAERPELSSFLLAGLAAGAAAATKYNGALALTMPLLAAGLAPAPGRRMLAAVVAAAGAGAGFLGGAPYSVLDLPNFLNGFASLMQHYNQPRSTGDTALVYIKHLRNWFSWTGVLPLGIGWIGLAVAALGMGVAGLFSRTRRTIALVLVLFPVCYLWFISNQGSLQYGRYVLPLTPMLSIFLGIGTSYLSRRLAPVRPRAGRLVPLAAALILLPSLGAAAAWNAAHGRSATAEQAGSWIVRQVPRGARVAIEGQVVRLPPSFRVAEMSRLIDETPDDLRRQRIDYLVASTTLSDRFTPGDLAAHHALLASSQVLQVFPGGRDHPGPTITVLRLVR
jgi:4-amino-4-deoxy-L-arabinose transferase-like glycosyltransferase